MRATYIIISPICFFSRILIIVVISYGDSLCFHYRRVSIVFPVLFTYTVAGFPTRSGAADADDTAAYSGGRGLTRSNSQMSLVSVAAADVESADHIAGAVRVEISADNTVPKPSIKVSLLGFISYRFRRVDVAEHSMTVWVTYFGKWDIVPCE